MKPDYQTSPTLIILAAMLSLCIAAWILPSASAQGPQVQVNAADPMAAEQGTINLNVKVTGKGFKNGAQAKWFVTGTTNPGGVTVNSTTFVSSTELTANITVADAATIANFDIQVTNSDGRGGKGTELFAVTGKGGQVVCPLPAPLPPNIVNCYGMAAGCLDTTYGVNGLVMSIIGTNLQLGWSAVNQRDDKLIVASQEFVIRFDTNGLLDRTFGDLDLANPPLRLGYTKTPFGRSTRGVQIDSNQRVLAGGIVSIPIGKNKSKSVGGVVRYNTDGSLDGSFGNGGLVTIDSLTFVSRLAVQSDGKVLLVAGSALARLNSDGSLDPTFGAGGITSVNLSSTSTGSGGGSRLVLQRIPAVTGEERIVVGGYAQDDAAQGSPVHFAIKRFLPNGAVDTSFGNSGLARADFLGFGSQLYDLAVDSSNRVVTVGTVRTADSSCGDYVADFGVARFTDTGLLDTTFSNDGLALADALGGWDTNASVAISSDGKIILAGTSYSSDHTVTNFSLVRFNTDGTPDSGFGLFGNGVVSTDFSGAGDGAWAMALQSDGKIIAVGYAEVSINMGGVGLARYWP